MKKDDFSNAVREMRAGHITSGEFYKRTYSAWVHMGKYLFRRWRAPVWLEIDEIVQELATEGWESVWNYDPDRDAKGKGLVWYVRWNAINKAKQRLHKARGVNMHREADKQRTPKVELGLSLCSHRRGADMPMANSFDTLAHAQNRVEATQEEDIAREEIAKEAVERALMSCVSEFERYVVRILAAGGDLEEAAVSAQRDFGQTVPESVTNVLQVARAVGDRVSLAA